MRPTSRCLKKKKPRSFADRCRGAIAALAALIAIAASATAVSAQERGPTAVSADALKQAINKLGDLDYPTRMAAGRTVRRSPAAQAVPALLQAVNEHTDG